MWCVAVRRKSRLSVSLILRLWMVDLVELTVDTLSVVGGGSPNVAGVKARKGAAREA